MFDPIFTDPIFIVESELNVARTVGINYVSPVRRAI